MLHPHRCVLLALALLAPAGACKSDVKAADGPGDKADDKADAPKPRPKVQTLDISSIDPALTGKLTIDVPPGSKLHPAGPGNVVVSGPQEEFFELLIGVEPRDLDIWRDNYEIVLDEGDLVVSKVEVGERGMLVFSSNIKVGERVFGCVPNTEGFLDREFLDRMIAACRSLRLE